MCCYIVAKNKKKINKKKIQTLVGNVNKVTYSYSQQRIRYLPLTAVVIWVRGSKCNFTYNGKTKNIKKKLNLISFCFLFLIALKVSQHFQATFAAGLRCLKNNVDVSRVAFRYTDITIHNILCFIQQKIKVNRQPNLFTAKQSDSQSNSHTTCCLYKTYIHTQLKN